MRDLADRYATQDPELSVDQARAEALLDLLLTNVTVTATVTLGIPVITGPAGEAAIADHAAENPPGPDEAAETGTDAASEGSDRPSETGKPGEGAACTDISDPGWTRPPVGTGGLGLGGSFSICAALVSGCEVPGIGFIDADTVEALLRVVPIDIGPALLDTRTATLVETVTTAYRPPKTLTDFVTTRDGTCRMWGCTHPATKCDIDHARPWPAETTSPTNLGGLCRRHHRLKQQRRWTYQLAPDGTATWTSPTGNKRITPRDHALLPPPQPKVEPAASPEQDLVAAEPPPF